MSSLHLSHCRLVATMDDAGNEILDASIVISDSQVSYLGVDPPVGPFDAEIDCRRFVAIPGLINSHHHLYQTLTRGFPESEGASLFPWLQMLYPIWAHLDVDMIHASTRTGLAELLLSGCTTCADHLYVFPPGSDSFIDTEIDAARSLGIRFHPTRGSMDLGQSQGGLPPDSVVQSIDEIMSDSERLIGAYHDPNPGAMIQIGLAPCSPFSVSPELMRLTAGLARRRGVRLHTHLAETLDEGAYSREQYGMSPVELLDSLDWLESDVWLAHCVHASESDSNLMAARGAAVAHCPTSNMLLGSGLAPIASFLQKGIPVGLGVDGSASNDANDLRMEVKQAVLAARIRDGVHAMPVRTALRLATRGGAACLGRDDIGCLQQGNAADIALFDSDSLEFSGGAEDVLAAIILSASRPHTVIVHGQVVVRDGRLLTANTEEIAREQRLQSRRLMSSVDFRARLD